MLQILTGSLILSLIHALIPNHWIPLIAISRAEKWTRYQTLGATLISGFSHTISTILIGVAVGFAGIKLAESYHEIVGIAAPLILILLGIIYLFIDLRSSHHHHHHHFDTDGNENIKIRSRTAIIISLSVAMFLTPCTEIEAYYFQAASKGWPGILAVSLVYVFTTVAVMLVLVYFGIKGMQRFRFHFLEHHDKRITGIVLILLGVLALGIGY
jgi:cadmium resistance protein CadD (predicted permease)